MRDNYRYLFVGNRVAVLKVMLLSGLNISEILVPEQSYAHRWAMEQGLNCTLFRNKKSLIARLINSEFDRLVSNGCPYILPISTLSLGERLFINIHPSLLPDLRGGAPINAAMLYSRKYGVACHLMDDGIDTGAVIGRIELPVNGDASLNTLYQLSYFAEGMVFRDALEKNFVPLDPQPICEAPIYYTLTDRNNDMYFDFTMSPTDICKKVKAFAVPTQCARFIYAGNEYKVMNASFFSGEPYEAMSSRYPNATILVTGPDCLLLSYNGGVLSLEGFSREQMQDFYEGLCLLK